jgi:8-oxo-dGTP pyrophosphatase MutT (NUDIX family)
MTAGSPVTPVDAATVILVRHGEPVGSPWQCFMVRRHIRSDFASDVYVFPGGKVDDADRDPALEPHIAWHPGPVVRGRDQRAWQGLLVAAVRELFEEAGVLLAYRDNQQLLRLVGEDGERFAEYRRHLRSGELDLGKLVRREGLTLAADRLHFFSHWITPVDFHRRYDTRFFVAYMPEHQTPLHDEEETVDSVWIAPRAALERFRDGEFPLVFATEKQLERMSRYRSIEQMIAETGEADLQPVMPRQVQHGGETKFLIPGDEGY